VWWWTGRGAAGRRGPVVPCRAAEVGRVDTAPVTVRRRRRVPDDSATDRCSTGRTAASFPAQVRPSVRHHMHTHIGWRRGVVVSGVRRMNEVNARRARLVPGWVTVFRRVYHFGM